ncbi:putative prenylcysteine lyase [Aspergillus homomorphus CBS 101889]|uniref:Prenylcysteine lyase n=1 Tax=Aspergillus homomorphus (strain CBS 101889) TaxID=1450537 RepID=A0A395HTM2_ASPHC|nr:prenylcysteine lyase [Aspergillus homomorphus CBS 101889]RAL10849.1 prenylcysteine lyase [Aspergillus homomorphus CBS 101889]
MNLLPKSLFTHCLMYTHLIYYVYLACLIPGGNAALQKPLSSLQEIAPKKVAIIGAGAAGASTAYSLRQYADAQHIPINITVFERSSYIGGRSTTVNVFDNPIYPIELGASIFVSVNYNLVNASRDLGLIARSADYARPKETDDTIGIWDGEQMVFVFTDSSSWWNLAKLLWRYGMAPVNAYRLMKSTVNKFLQLYDGPMFPFQSLTLATQAVGLLDTTALPGLDYLRRNGISDFFSREIIQASTRVNYGQNLGLIHGLETMVCLATDGAMAIEGGNWQIFDGMLKASGADVRINHTVTSLNWAADDDDAHKTPPHPTTLTFKPNNPSAEQVEDYDEIVIAAPYHFTELTTTRPLETTPDKIPFVTLHVTLFSSPHRLSPEHFNLPGPTTPETILTTLPLDLDATVGKAEKGVGPANFWSISTLRTVTPPSPLEEADGEQQQEQQQHYVYKIFSPERPTAAFIRSILGLADQKDKTTRSPPSGHGTSNSSIEDLPREDVSWFHEKVWRPYPFVYPRVTFEEVELAPHVWYTGAIESFISTMETSALMGKNVAALMVKGWEEEREKAEAVSMVGSMGFRQFEDDGRVEL